jgi:hypothetical protein
MKKIIITFTLLLMATTMFGQNLFSKFEEDPDIKNVIVNKKMFQLLSKMDVKDKETQQYVTLIKKLDNLKVFMTSNDKKATELKSTAEKYLKSASLEELMRVNEGTKNVKIYVKSGATDSQIKELLMMIDGAGKDETVVMSLTGSFDIAELSLLTDKMNLPGGESLKKASKGKK